MMEQEEEVSYAERLDATFRAWQDELAEQLRTNEEGIVLRDLYQVVKRAFPEMGDARIEQLLRRRLQRCRMRAYHKHQPPIVLVEYAIASSSLVWDLPRGVVRNVAQPDTVQYEMLVLVNADDYDAVVRGESGNDDETAKAPRAGAGARAPLADVPRVREIDDASIEPAWPTCSMCGEQAHLVDATGRAPGWLIGRHRSGRDVHVCPPCLHFVKTAVA